MASPAMASPAMASGVALPYSGQWTSTGQGTVATRNWLRMVRTTLAASTIALIACGDGDDWQPGTGGSGGTAPPVQLDPTDFTYRLAESTGELVLWTTPATHKVRNHERAPETERSGLQLSAARNEFEPVQLLLGPASGSVTATIDPFPDLGGNQRVELSVVGYESGWSEHLTPLSSGGSISLSGDQPAPLWITVYVPTGAPAGDHETTLHLAPSAGGGIDVPVQLRVFDFDLPGG